MLKNRYIFIVPGTRQIKQIGKMSHITAILYHLSPKIGVYKPGGTNDCFKGWQILGAKPFCLFNGLLYFFFNQDEEEAFVPLLPEGTKKVFSLHDAVEEDETLLHHNGFAVYYHLDDEEEKHQRLLNKRKRARKRRLLRAASRFN